VKAFYGNFGVLVRAYTYIRMLGDAGMRSLAENAVLNANYLKVLVEKAYKVKYPGAACTNSWPWAMLPRAYAPWT
jgi:glycine dehydrogenase subunit 2